MPPKGHKEIHRPLGRNVVIRQGFVEEVADSQLAAVAIAKQVTVIPLLECIVLLRLS